MKRGTLITLSLALAAASCGPTRTVRAPSTPAPVTAVGRGALPVVPPSAHLRNVAILLYPGVELLDFAGPAETFAANRHFRVYTVAATHEPLVSQRIVTVTPEYSFDDAPRPDIVVIPGGSVGQALGSPATMAWLSRVVAQDELTMSVCNGAYALAKTGALDGHRATTHWQAVGGLREAAPRVILAPEERYIDEGRVMSTAGISAGIDGALHVVQRFAGDESAWRTARYMQYAWEPDDATISPERREAMRAWIMHDWAAAAKAYGALAAKQPDDGHAHARFGDALTHLGRIDEGLSELARARALGQRDPQTLDDQAHAFLAAKRFEAAGQTFADLAAVDDAERAFASYNQACALAALGRRDDAFAALDRAVAAGFTDAASLEKDPDLAPLRQDARLAALVATLRRPAKAPTASPVAPLTWVVDYEPSWSPDGRRIALISSRHGGMKLHILDATDHGAGMRQLTFDRAEDDSPAWSPDGKRIAFVSVRDGVSQIDVINADGTGRHPVTHGAAENIHPAWTPDGARVLIDTTAFAAARPPPDTSGKRAIGDATDDAMDLATVAADGTDLRRLTTGGGYTYASYSADGRWIVFRRIEGDVSRIFVMNADGTGAHDVSGGGTHDGWPSFSPNGARIAFARKVGDTFHVFVMNRDGSDLRQVTDGPGRFTNPRWSPDGKTILFSRRLGDMTLMTLAAPPP